MIKQKRILSALSVLGVMYFVTACGNKPSDPPGPTTAIGPAKLYNAASIPGSWTPDLTTINGGVDSTKSNVIIQQKPSVNVTAGMVRLNEAWGSKEVLVNLGSYNASDFGVNGSITLQAEVTGYPRNGGAYAVLTSFYVVKSGGGTQEYVNLAAACANTSGVWSCSGGYCSPNAACQPTRTGSSSSFYNRSDWEQHQFQSFGYGSTNSFPRCDSINDWECASGLNSLPSGNYYAKYILMSDSGSSVASVTANLKVTPTIRKDNTARGNENATNGGIKINVILVGDKNISDSHTAKGEQNLNLLFKETHRILKQNAGIGINDVKVYEWYDADHADYYSQVPIEDVGIMFASATQTLDASDEGEYINVFLVRAIEAQAGAQYTILGVSGGILGATMNGTQTSGLAFSTYTQAGDGLAAYNPSCSASGSCDRNSQTDTFIEMGATVAHELGHYLGLNHPSETALSSSSQRHDQLSDTPTCAPRTVGSSTYLDQLSCYQDSTSQGSGSGSAVISGTCASKCDAATGGHYYVNVGGTYQLNNLCPDVQECQFNHIMWYTTKKHMWVGGGWQDDGSHFSPQSQALLQWNPFVQ